ncbi:hypothetical protein K1T71_011438 [Dendrolimus kikuchii]|uniref:Uncharacterized protein n=1 Tax=Dendrolimus kikuchii TaxID=765133 RepID=A0ACC1CP63_9NEOP|nr:hypothetical protein K1T71_011438 [Dendrolimus kikuchii]
MNSFLRPVYDSYTESQESTKELEENSTSESSIDLLTNCSPSRHSDLASKSNIDTIPNLKRKPLNGPELIPTRAQTVEAFKLVKQSDQLRDDDECSTFGILIAQKLRKLTETRRDFIMARINQVFYEENMQRERQFTSQHSISSTLPRHAESSYMTMPTEVVSNDNSDYDQGFVLKEESCSSSDM